MIWENTLRKVLIKNMIKADIMIRNAKVAILGFTFKENCPDTRNTKVIDIFKELKEYGIISMVVDPIADEIEAERLYGIKFNKLADIQSMDAVIIAVAHDQFKSMEKKSIDCLFNIKHQKKVLFDVKGILDKEEYSAENGYIYWRL